MVLAYSFCIEAKRCRPLCGAVCRQKHGKRKVDLRGFESRRCENRCLVAKSDQRTPVKCPAEKRGRHGIRPRGSAFQKAERAAENPPAPPKRAGCIGHMARKTKTAKTLEALWRVTGGGGFEKPGSRTEDACFSREKLLFEDGGLSLEGGRSAEVSVADPVSES